MIVHGWVNVGGGDLRPAYRREDGVTVYSPRSAGKWTEAPAEIAATWLAWYAGDKWAPFTAPEGMRVVS